MAPAEGCYRVLRGGSWLRRSKHCRAAYRNKAKPHRRFNFAGFRVVLEPDSPLC